MLNRNRAPKLAVLGMTLALSACIAETGAGNTESTTPSSTNTKPSYVGDDILPKILSTCTGRLDGFKPSDPSWSKDGNIYEVTSVVEGPCASVYDLSTFKGVGGLAVGDEFIGGCTFDNKPARIHVLAPISTGDTVGDVNLTEAGMKQVEAANMPSCESQDVPDRGFFIPS